ncbi:TetR family transcriptional regulator [Microlunatus endophyticus]|uniref:TetR family transcriptional regulator n=1 Tax=Microlunatus endophyticus TaxID=1716077 RepID=A0A917W6S7_9ACTN|nr:TetR family transcriptional regulator [Microlunatus endophyticus]GGL70857.1 TetR family transcriptional regulator [Microlunatus endophyticus]
MERDAEATKRRLIDAATKEFAAYGIAGARVDRIAADAKSNKAQIYHYFGSKDALFDAAFSDMARGTVDDVPIDAHDLPEYAGRLYDSYERRPWVRRLVTWYLLERADGSQGLVEAVVESNSAKVAAIAQAQRDGALDDAFSAAEVLGLVVHVSLLWAVSLPEYLAVLGPIDDARRRQIVVDAVRRLIG